PVRPKGTPVRPRNTHDPACRLKHAAEAGTAGWAGSERLRILWRFRKRPLDRREYEALIFALAPSALSTDRERDPKIVGEADIALAGNGIEAVRWALVGVVTAVAAIDRQRAPARPDTEESANREGIALRDVVILLRKACCGEIAKVRERF